MRLIDADRAMEIVRDQGIAHPNAYHLTNYAMLILREAPTVDAVEVVSGRCKMDGGAGLMDVREKLIDLLTGHSIDTQQDVEYVADHLISNGVTVQEWISVDDRLPEEKVNCIVYYKHAYCDNDDYWAIGICFYDGEKFQMDLLYKVTHWQYLPQPPKGE